MTPGLPVSLFPPANAVPFNEASYIGIPAIGANANVIQFQVPQGYNGVIKWIANNFVGGGWVEGSGSLVYQISADGAPFRNHEDIVASLGNPSAPSEIAPLRIFENQIITLSVQNVNLAPSGQFIGGRLSGWFYPIDEEPAESWV